MKPKAIQPIKRNHVSNGSENISSKQIRAPKIGTNGTRGVLKGLGKLGLLRLNIITATQTIAKASKVPIETNLLRMSIGRIPANIKATIPVII